MPEQSNMIVKRVKDGVEPRVRVLPVPLQVAGRQSVAASGPSAAARPDTGWSGEVVGLPVQFLGPVRFVLSFMRMDLPAAPGMGMDEDGRDAIDSPGYAPVQVQANDGSSALSG